jgi:hypothetical protein
MLSLHSHGQVPCSPITKAGLLGSLEKRVLSSKELVRELKRCYADFELTSEVENEIRGAGKYLGKKGLDDLILAVRDNYRPIEPATVSPRKPEGNEANPLTLWYGIAIKGRLKPERLDAIMTRAGYKGPTSMSALSVSNAASSTNEMFIGTHANLTSRSGQLLLPGGHFDFSGGESTTRVYVLALKDVIIDIGYRPVTPKSDWKESDEAKQLASQILNNIQALIDEGRVMDLTDYQHAVKVYGDWIEKCAMKTGEIDNQMRRFVQETTFRDEFEKATSNKPRPSSGKDNEVYEREFLRSAIKIALSQLDLVKKLVQIDTMPDRERIRMPLPGSGPVSLLYRLHYKK